jgi:hypothetical protein
MDKNIVKKLKAQVTRLNKALTRATDPRGTKAYDKDPNWESFGKRKKSKLARATYPGGTKAYDKKYGNK